VRANPDQFGPLVPGGTIGSSPLSRRVAIDRQRRSVRNVTAAEPTFSVVTTSDLRPVDQQSKELSRSQAQARLTQLVDEGRSRDDLDIIPSYRAAA
jgi:hypothetical protein